MVSETLKGIEEKMKASVKLFRADLATIRTGHATPALVEHIRVDYAGTPMSLNQLAGISAPEAGLLVIQPWDKSSLRDIEKAILKSELGLNPTNDGNIIRIAIPPLSEERRQELIKIVHRRTEERRIAIRNLRHEALNGLKQLEKDKEISQDELKRSQEQLQKLTDFYIMEAEKSSKGKEEELAEV
ncbi:MAG: ribosome recycling factor [Chloroflexi bacterium RBG_13_51_52]|nr:MAG: ribosome recycling factor [Chloroflexi bacterium RBG_13_51_52]